ncbi:hypothetical protein Tco_0474915 [Tanacetum coccineum]
MHTSKDDYLINSLRFVSAKESTQIFGAILPECLTSLAIKESKAYKTYLGYATGVVPPKMAQKFKKASPSKKDSDLVPIDEEPIQKCKRVKRPAKKSTTKPAAEIVSPLDVHVHHEVPRTHAPTLLTVLVSVITESSPVYTNIPQSSQVFTPPPPLATPTPPPTIETTNPLSTLPDFASILPKEVSNFAPHVIEALIKESRDEVTLAKVSSQPLSTYEAASTLTEFEVKKILIDKIVKSESYLAAPEHRDCYDSLKKSYDLNKDFFFSYDVYSLKRSRKDKDKDEDLSAESDQGLKKRKLSKDAEPTTGPKKKDSTSGSSK